MNTRAPFAPLSPRTRRLSFLGIGLALVLPLAGCFLIPGANSSSSTPTGEDVAENLTPYYSQVLVWEDCEYDAQCTTAKAPMDWENPSADTDIELALSRHLATGNTTQGSLFMNPGGPGGSGFDYVQQAPEQVVGASVRKEFDLIGWDPRGVGRSTPVSCLEPADLDRFLFGSLVSPVVDSPEWVAEITAENKAFADGCLENTGASLEFVDTVSTTRDLDMLRAVVGDKKLNYFGYSYGTTIGLTYIGLFPEKVGRLVLDGVADPAETTFDTIIGQTKGFDASLQAYVADCLAGPDCPFTGDAENAMATIATWYETLAASPLPHSDGREFNDGVLDTAINMALYSEETWPVLTDMFTELNQGVTDTGYRLADYYYGRAEDGTYLDNSFEAFVAINCLDQPVVTDPAEIAAFNAALLAASPTTVHEVSSLPDPLCGNWPFPAKPGIGEITGEGADPVLIVSQTGDPATPYAGAVAVAEKLKNAVLITRQGDDHIAYDENDPCVNDLVDIYFLTGRVPSADPMCGV